MKVDFFGLYNRTILDCFNVDPISTTTIEAKKLNNYYRLSFCLLMTNRRKMLNIIFSVIRLFVFIKCNLSVFSSNSNNTAATAAAAAAAAATVIATGICPYA
uniref:Uncharacterized protein n=1 Tax=Glossina pallidipes TaxID=7398 RepID=A0A1A9ZD04_GLOPL